MALFTLLLIVYLLFFLGLLFFLDQHSRNYWRRALIPLLPCPFSDRVYAFEEIESSGLRSDREGIFSYALYGNYKKYTPILCRSLDKVKEYMPTWQARIYLAANIPNEIKEIFLDKGAEIIVMGPHSPIGHEGALWRFLPLEQELPFLCLDADDLFDLNRANQTKEWLKSGQPFCNLSDVISFIPMTANSWGARGKSIPDIRHRIAQYCEYWYGFDEAFLKKEVWPLAQERGCWIASYLRFDYGVIVYWIILVALIVYTLYLASRYC